MKSRYLVLFGLLFSFCMSAFQETSAKDAQFVPAPKVCMLTLDLAPQDLAEKAGIIFLGKLKQITIDEEKDAYEHEFEVVELLKKPDGDLDYIDEEKETATLRVWTGLGKMEIKPGEEKLIFAYTPSPRTGFTSAVGNTDQGIVDKKGNKLVYSPRAKLALARKAPGGALSGKFSLAQLVQQDSAGEELETYSGLKDFLSQ